MERDAETANAVDNAVVRSNEGELAILTLDHPPLNLFDEAMARSLGREVAGLRADSPRAALIRANGKVVSGGVDVKRFAGANVAEGTDQMVEFMSIAHLVESLPFPTVFAAHGLTLTAAFELALACDMIVASESASFGLVEATVGLSPGMGGTQRLARIAGPNRAREFVMTGDIYPAETMAEWGVVNRVHPNDNFEAEAMALARRLAEGPTLAHAVTKDVIRAWDESGNAGADRLAPTAVGGLYETDDFQGGVRSLLENGPGKATFKGS